MPYCGRCIAFPETFTQFLVGSKRQTDGLCIPNINCSFQIKIDDVFRRLFCIRSSFLLFLTDHHGAGFDDPRLHLPVTEIELTGGQGDPFLLMALLILHENFIEKMARAFTNLLILIDQQQMVFGEVIKNAFQCFIKKRSKMFQAWKTFGRMKFLFQLLKLWSLEFTADLVKFSLCLTQGLFVENHLTAWKQNEGIQKFLSRPLALNIKGTDA